MPYIEPTLYGAALSPLADAVEEAFPDRQTAFKRALLHSAEVFAAFKVHTAGRSMLSLLLDSDGNLKPFEQWSRDVMPIASHQMGSWLRTEYNTAILRAHQAADWQRFEADKDVLPNLRWVPSTSVTPGKDHMPFWGTILPVDHPFWSHHRPGDRWNCKCSLEATDDEVTPVPDDESGRISPPQKGLKSNPSKTAELFDQSHPYFPDSCASCPFNSGLKNSLTTFFSKKQKDCCNCAKVNKAIPEPQIDLSKITDNQELYELARQLDDYTIVYQDPDSKGVLVVHKDHSHLTYQQPKKKTILTEEWLLNEVSGDSAPEIRVALSIAKMGCRVILCNEKEKDSTGNKIASLDLIVNGVRMDIKTIFGVGDYANFLSKKNKQLWKYNSRFDVETPASRLCVYFPHGDYNPTLMEQQIKSFKDTYYNAKKQSI